MRISILGLVALALSTLAAAGSVASAQSTTSDSLAAIKVAVISAKTLLPDGATGIGFADHLQINESRATEIATALGQEYGSLKQKRSCTGPNPSYCHLVGLKAFIEIEDMTIYGDTARVNLTLLDETASRRQPIHYQDVQVLLTHSSAAWRKLIVRVLSET